MADAPTPPNANERAAALVEKLWNDGKIGGAVRAAAKELYPDVVIPEDQIDPLLAPVRAEVAELQKTLADERAERAREKEEAQATSMKQNLEASLDAARARYGLTEEGFDRMTARMKETGNFTDAEAAAAWVAQQTPAAPVSKANWLPQKLDLFGSATARDDADFKLLHTNPMAYQDKMLAEFVADPDRFVRETLAA